MPENGVNKERDGNTGNGRVHELPSELLYELELELHRRTPASKEKKATKLFKKRKGGEQR